MSALTCAKLFSGKTRKISLAYLEQLMFQGFPQEIICLIFSFLGYIEQDGFLLFRSISSPPEKINTFIRRKSNLRERCGFDSTFLRQIKISEDMYGPYYRNVGKYHGNLFNILDEIYGEEHRTRREFLYRFEVDAPKSDYLITYTAHHCLEEINIYDLKIYITHYRDEDVDYWDSPELLTNAYYGTAC